MLDQLKLPQPVAEAQQWFVDFCGPLLRHWARRGNVAPGDVEDVVQEAFAVILEQLPRFTYDPNRRFRGYLRKVFAGCLGRYWERRRARRLEVPASGLASAAALEDDRSALSRLCDEDFDRFVLPRALAAVAADVQETTLEAFRRTVLAGEPVAAVAQALGLSAGAVRVAQFRVKQRLREVLGELVD
jgi:RNA polymerase sigma-70 factor (ECF subfamily)